MQKFKMFINKYCGFFIEIIDINPSQNEIDGVNADLSNNINVGENVKIFPHTLIGRYKGWLGQKFGKIIINDNCEIGQGTLILPFVKIGENT